MKYCGYSATGSESTWLKLWLVPYLSTILYTNCCNTLNILLLGSHRCLFNYNSWTTKTIFILPVLSLYWNCVPFYVVPLFWKWIFTILHHVIIIAFFILTANSFLIVFSCEGVKSRFPPLTIFSEFFLRWSWSVDLGIWNFFSINDSCKPFGFMDISWRAYPFQVSLASWHFSLHIIIEISI